MNRNIRDETLRPRKDLPTLDQVEQLRAHYAWRKKFLRTLASTLGILLVICAVAVLLTLLFFPVLKVSGQSMEPTLHNGDILLLVNDHQYKRQQLTGIAWENKILIKRIIGLPGDQIDIDPDGTVYVNGEKLDEPYVNEKSLGSNNQEYPLHVPDGKLFVLGDQRESSIDSRNSRIGLVDEDQVIGRVALRLWPWIQPATETETESVSVSSD